MSTHDLTQGSVGRTLMKFTVPFLLANLLQTFYSIVDLIVVGQFADAAAISSVSVGGIVVATLTSFIIGLTTGGTVLIGQFCGSKQEKNVQESVQTLFTLTPLIAIALSVIFMFLVDPLLKLLNTPPEAYEGARHYMQICIIGLVFTSGYNAISAALRAMGDSKNPLLFVLIACVFNILGDLVLVAGFNMGAEGAAIATMLGQALSMILGIVFLKRKNFIFDFKPSSFGIKKEKAAQLLKLGIPISLQEVLVMSSFVVIEGFINNLGYIATAAAGVADKLFTVAVIPSSSFSASIAAMAAQNMGAGRQDRMRKCLVIGSAWSFAVGVVLFLLVWFAPQVPLALFTQDKAVVASASNYLISYKYEYLLCSVAFCMHGFINGSGHTKFTLWNNIISTFVVRLPLVWLFSRAAGATLMHIGIAFPIASAVQLIGAAVYIASGRWRRGTISENAIGVIES